MVGKGYEHTINSKDESAFGVAGVAELAEIELRCRHGVCATDARFTLYDDGCTMSTRRGRCYR